MFHFSYRNHGCLHGRQSCPCCRSSSTSRCPTWPQDPYWPYVCFDFKSFRKWCAGPIAVRRFSRKPPPGEWQIFCTTKKEYIPGFPYIYRCSFGTIFIFSLMHLSVNPPPSDHHYHHPWTGHKVGKCRGLINCYVYVFFVPWHLYLPTLASACLRTYFSFWKIQAITTLTDTFVYVNSKQS